MWTWPPSLSLSLSLSRSSSIPLFASQTGARPSIIRFVGTASRRRRLWTKKTFTSTLPRSLSLSMSLNPGNSFIMFFEIELIPSLSLSLSTVGGFNNRWQQSVVSLAHRPALYTHTPTELTYYILKGNLQSFYGAFDVCHSSVCLQLYKCK